MIFVLAGTDVAAQVLVQGKVFDISRRSPLEAVSVMTTTGKGTITDSSGRYSINVKETDTLFFSYLGKGTNKFAVAEIPDHLHFDISIHVVVNELPGVTVKNRNYLLDSIQNRKDYAKVFNYRKPTLRLATNPNYTPGVLGAAFDLEQLINIFRFKHNRQTEALQKRLIQQEQDKYIDRRFNKRFITRITGLQGEVLDSFMLFYRPPYEFLLTVNELELGMYIEESMLHFDRVRKGELILPPRIEVIRNDD